MIHAHAAGVVGIIKAGVGTLSCVNNPATCAGGVAKAGAGGVLRAAANGVMDAVTSWMVDAAKAIDGCRPR